MNRNKFGCLCCEGCKSYNLKLRIAYDGLDCESEAGEGSGFGYKAGLECVDCGRLYYILRLKGMTSGYDYSELKETEYTE